MIIQVIYTCAVTLQHYKFTNSSRIFLPLIAFPFIVFTINTLTSIQIYQFDCIESINDLYTQTVLLLPGKNIRVN